MSAEYLFGKAAIADRFLAGEHLVLLLTPFPFLFVAKVIWILGFNEVAALIDDIWIVPTVIFTFASLIVVPILLMCVLALLIGRNIWLRRWKRLGLYALTLLVLPVAVKAADEDYLRFKLHEGRFDAAVGEASAKDIEATCFEFVFDRVQDNFYFGGANFAPYDKIVIYVRPGFDGRCEALKSLRGVRLLTGRYYLGERLNNG